MDFHCKRNQIQLGHQSPKSTDSMFHVQQVLQGSTPAEKKSFLDYTFLTHFKNYPVLSEQMFLAAALRRVITPMLVHAWKCNYINEVLSPPVLSELRAFLLEPRPEVSVPFLSLHSTALFRTDVF